MELSGLYAPIPVPFDDEQNLAPDRFEENLQRWIAQPLDGVVLPGSNSEAPYLSDEERRQLWQQCGQAYRASGKHWAAGTGAERTHDTIRLTQQAAQYGAAATLVVPPHYYRRSMTHAALTAHYRALADASPIPVFIYNIPAFTGIDFELQTLLALSEHPNIAGMKDSSSNVVKMGMLRQQRPDFQVFAGTGGALLPFLSIGASGGIMALANFAAAPLRRLLAAVQSGDLALAREIQLSLAGINHAVTAGYGVPGLKYALDRLGYYGGPPRPPLLPADEAARAHIDGLLEPLVPQLRDV